MELTLSAEQVMSIAGIPVTLIKYSDLHKHRSINSVFGKNKAILLLYERRPNFGHWVCLIKHSDSIHYFDSYGFEPDDPLEFTNIQYKKKLNMDLPYLTGLLYCSPKPIDFSDRQLQKTANNINTCGRHCGWRIRNFNLSNDEYLKLFESVSLNKMDKLITKITNEFI